MTKKELLRWRYKVILDYPESPFKINEIIDGNILVTAPIGLNGPKCASDFPGIFKKLEWYEERDEKDLPKYVEMLEDVPYFGFKKGQIVEVTAIRKCIGNDMNKYSIALKNKPLISMDYVTPADVEEEEGEDKLDLKTLKYLFSTDQTNVVYVAETNEFCRYPSDSKFLNNLGQYVSLYIVSNDTIELGDYYTTKDSKTVISGVHRADTQRLVDIANEFKASKIVASTQELEGVVQFSKKLIDLAIKQLNATKSRHKTKTEK